MKKILIIEDDKVFQNTLTTALEMENFKVLSSLDGGEGFRMATQEKFDLIVLDLVLPTMTGMEVCKELRKKEIMTPIIMLTGQKKEEIDKVLGLELGADDYLLKPFGIKEFLARINAILRRTQPRETDIEEYTFGDVYIHFKKQIAKKAKKDISFTSKEYGLLKLLVSHEGEVVSRNAILILPGGTCCSCMTSRRSNTSEANDASLASLSASMRVARVNFAGSRIYGSTTTT